MTEKEFEELPTLVLGKTDEKYEIRQLFSLADPAFAVVGTGKGIEVIRIRDVALVRHWTRDGGERSKEFVSDELILPINRESIGHRIPDPPFWPTDYDPADFHGCFDTLEAAEERADEVRKNTP